MVSGQTLLTLTSLTSYDRNCIFVGSLKVRLLIVASRSATYILDLDLFPAEDLMQIFDGRDKLIVMPNAAVNILLLKDRKFFLKAPSVDWTLLTFGNFAEPSALYEASVEKVIELTQHYRSVQLCQGLLYSYTGALGREIDDRVFEMIAAWKTLAMVVRPIQKNSWKHSTFQSISLYSLFV